jgi:hypothetical protein
LSDVVDQVLHGAISFAGGFEIEATKQRGRKYQAYAFAAKKPSFFNRLRTVSVARAP